jgi:hypothetical protein
LTAFSSEGNTTCRGGTAIGQVALLSTVELKEVGRTWQTIGRKIGMHRGAMD